MREQISRAGLLARGSRPLSAGAYTRTAIEAMGTALDFWRVRMRPGAPLGFGQRLCVDD